jgi:hypothetical protein
MSDPMATSPGPIWRKEHARLALLNAALEKLQAAQLHGDLARVKEAVELLEDLKRSLDDEAKQEGNDEH